MILGLRLGLRRHAAPAKDPTHIDVTHGDDVFRVAVKRATGARRFTLRVSAATGDVVLTLPTRGDLARAQDFALRHGGWIASRMAKLPAGVEIGPGAIIPFRGEDHLVEHRAQARGTVWTERMQGRGPARLVVAGSAEHAPRRVADFLKREAKKDLDAAVLKYTTALGVRAVKITLRDTRSRWGSCSAAGRLNFSWRLILAPPFVLDYLAAHEVAHLKEMNHSPRFWRIVHKLCDRTDEAEAWLKRHGSSLHRYR
ncbi:M48 family metallopeptidase [Alsobacter sp. SYSU M60028]|uniref:M48 family metallopeptidase n=1 Tax=Alsobacter ponti TaxID=2962936 RepID=A0ABT1LEY4_9HYPH|nr:SprT family zinc-dependent metalloprotease [Alsobacter ponti]MCP8938808.1 M48 family metallopeptidase [Alsobacter ponti]